MNEVMVKETGTQVQRIETKSERAQLMEIIRDAALNPACDPAKMHALMDLQNRVVKQQAEEAFNHAFAEMSPRLPRIKKNGSVAYKDKNGNANEAFKHMKWEDIDAAIRPILNEYGFSLSFDTAVRQGEGGGLVITGTLLHRDGHARSTSMPLPLDSSGGKNNLQAGGSTFSYGKRYTTTMLLNIVAEGEDDDGVRGGMEFITEDSVRTLREQLTETGSDEKKFLEMIGYDIIENIQQKDLSKAINMLQAKRRAMARKATEQPKPTGGSVI